MQKHIGKIIVGVILFSALLLVSETADRVFLSATSSVVCSVSGSDLCVRINNKLADYTPGDAAQKHFASCTQNKAVRSCLNASVLFAKVKNFPFVIHSLNHACALGDKGSCQQGYRVAQKYLNEAEESHAAAKELKVRQQLALMVYGKGCEMGEGEACALAARSPLTVAKASYSLLYRGCYTLNHPSACIGLADYFKAKGQSKMAENAVARVCKGKRSLACLDLVDRLSDRKSAQSRMLSSTKYN